MLYENALIVLIVIATLLFVPRRCLPRIVLSGQVCGLKRPLGTPTSLRLIHR